jgi:hypothetical protein
MVASIIRIQSALNFHLDRILICYCRGYKFADQNNIRKQRVTYITATKCKWHEGLLETKKSSKNVWQINEMVCICTMGTETRNKYEVLGEKKTWEETIWKTLE